MGPFEISDDNTLTLRPYRWNKNVNMLYIESPVGVGFSYSTDNNYKCDDDRTADQNMLAMADFFEKFPQLKANGFFIVGESYAGIYVPTLAEAIIKATKSGTWAGAELKGIAAGNGCSGNEIGICGSGPQGTAYEWLYLLQTGFIENSLKLQINQACDFQGALKQQEGALSAKCIQLLTQASAQIQNVNLYDVYGDCVSDSGCPANHEATLKPKSKVPLHNTFAAQYLAAAPSGPGADKGYMSPRVIPNGPVACIDSKTASSYLNQPNVMKAIHVEPPTGNCWSVCGTAPGWSYNSTRANLPRDTYPLLVANIKVVVYNGDWDACVPFTDNEGWTSGMAKSMGLPTAKEWHPWKYTSASGAENQVAGYAVEYDVSGVGEGKGTFEFITVKGGRHEVPESAPAQAFEMITRLTNGKAF
jgi:serine carboxypeptidase-like clade 1